MDNEDRFQYLRMDDEKNKNDVISQIVHADWSKVSAMWMAAGITILMVAVSQVDRITMIGAGICMLLLSYAAHRMKIKEAKP